MIDRYEVVAPLGEDIELRPYDLVVATYDLFQLGTWYVDYQVGKLEQKLAEDGRFVLTAYEYDETAKTLTVEMRVRDPSEMPDAVRRGVEGVATGGIGVGELVVVALLATLLGVVLGVLGFIAYRKPKEVHTYRRAPELQSILDDPDFPQEKKDAILQAEVDAQAAGAASVKPITLGAELGFIGIALIGLYLYLCWSHV